MPKCILILEDNADRREAMRWWAEDRLPMYDLVMTDDPAEFVAHSRERWADILTVSLDHDLYDRPDHTTELTGMRVVDFLVDQPPAFPVLLHTSNRQDGETMRARLTDRGWRVNWVTPFDGVEWVGGDWYPAVKRVIRATVRRDTRPPDDDRD